MLCICSHFLYFPFLFLLETYYTKKYKKSIKGYFHLNLTYNKKDVIITSASNIRCQMCCRDMWTHISFFYAKKKKAGGRLPTKIILCFLGFRCYYCLVTIIQLVARLIHTMSFVLPPFFEISS